MTLGKLTISLALTALLTTSACAAPVVTMPTATLAPQGTAQLNYYPVDLNSTNPHAPESISIMSAYIGLAPRLELDVTYLKPDELEGKTNLGFEYLALREGKTGPAFAVGAEDVTQQSGDTSYYAVLVKTITPVRGGRYPVIKLNLGYGTEPRSALFGGIQLRLTQEASVGALSDGHKSIFTLAYFVPKSPLVLKAGTWGDARWVGVQYNLAL